MNRRSVRLLLAMAVPFGCLTVALCQSKEDRATVAKAREAYLTTPVPGSIACGVELDWDKFFEEMKVPLDEAGKARVAKLKTAKIAFVTKGATQTEVKVEAPDGFASMADGLRQQLDGFFQMYWSESYGRLLEAKPDDSFELTTTASGYTLKSAAGGAKVALEMDKAFVITGETVASPQMNAVMTPTFKPGADGLLRLRGVDETVDLGETKMVVSVGLDYQKVGEFEVPQHVRMALPGSYAFDYTFVGCEVTGARPVVSLGKK